MEYEYKWYLVLKLAFFRLAEYFKIKYMAYKKIYFTSEKEQSYISWLKWL
jgi:hypothetical protein